MTSAHSDDGDLFVPNASTSNLAHLFHHEGELKSSLIYTPHKQPQQVKDQFPQQPSKQQKKLVCVKAISLQQVNNLNNITSIGKCGIAIIADQEAADLILYKTKQNILSSTRLTNGFIYKHWNGTGISFTDDQTMSWMAAFDSTIDKMEFLAELQKREAMPDEECTGQVLQTRLIAEKPEEEEKRADILGRMAKIGLTILPCEAPSLIPATPPVTVGVNESDKTMSESEPEEVIRTSLKARKLRGRHSESSIETRDLVVPKSNANFSYSSANISNFPGVVSHQLMDPLHVHFAENRTHNSEMRMNISQLGSKLDMLIASASFNGERDALQRRVDDLERKLGLLSIGKQVHIDSDKEMKHLSEALQERNAQLEKALQTVDDFSQEIDRLKQMLDGSNDRISEFERDNDRSSSFEQLNAELTEQVKQLKGRVQGQSLVLTQHKDMLRQTEEVRANLVQDNESLNNSLRDCEIKCAALQMQCQQVLSNNTKDEDEFAKIVKETMNVLYQNVLTDSTKSDIRDLQKILQKHLKLTTFQIISQYSKRRDVHKISSHNVVSVSPEFEVTV